METGVQFKRAIGVVVMTIGVVAGATVVGAEETPEADAGAEEPEITADHFGGGAPPPGDWRESYWGWDANIDISAVRRAGDWGAAGSLRVGVMRVDEPFALTLGPTAEIATDMATRFGLEAELTNLHMGLYGQLGAGIEIDGSPVATGAVGWTLLSVETQYRPAGDAQEDSEWALLGQIRIPVNWLFEAFTN